MVGKCDSKKKLDQVRGVEQHAVQPVLLHPEVDRARDDVTRREFGASRGSAAGAFELGTMLSARARC